VLQAFAVPRRARGSRVATALLVVLAVVLLAPMLAYPFGSDHGVFATAADGISHGRIPYRDIWDNKPPGVDYLFWAAFHLFGRSMLSIRLLDLLWTLATALLLYLVGKRLLSKEAGVIGAGAFLVFYALGFDFWHTAQCDGFASLPLVAAALLALVAEARRKPALALASGALVGVAMTFKFTVAGLLLVPLALAAAAREDEPRPRVTRAIAALAGCALLLGAVAVALWRAGALRGLIEAVFVWNRAYGEIQAPDPFGHALRFLFGGQYAVLPLIGAMAVIGLADLAWRRPRHWWLAPTWAVVMLAGVIVQGKYYAYHWLPVLPPVGLLAGQGMWAVLEGIGRKIGLRRARWVAAAAGLVVGSLLTSAWLAQFHWPLRYVSGKTSAKEYAAQFTTPGGYFSLSADLATADYVREHTGREAPVFVWGLEPLVYFLADRAPASRYTYIIPLLAPWSGPEVKQRALADLRHRPPEFILVVHNDAQPWATGWRGDSYSYLAMGVFPEFTEVLTTQYRLATRMEDFDVWQRTLPAGR